MEDTVKTKDMEQEEPFSDLLESDPEPPLRMITITVMVICAVFIVGFLLYIMRATNSPQKECAYRGGVWSVADQECVFESAGQGSEQVGMKAETILLTVPETAGASKVTFPNVEIGAPHKGVEQYGEGATRGAVSLIAEFGRVHKASTDLVMPFAVQSGGSGVFVYLGIFEKTESGYSLRDTVFVGDRIGPQGLSFSAQEGKDFSARFSYRDRRAGEPYSAVPTEPRTIDVVIHEHALAESFVLGRGGLLYKDVLSVSSPALRAEVTSPLTVTGEARGNWYFEASFPVSLVSDTGTVLAEGQATAKGDWMTEDFVPFSATLSWKDFPAELPLTASLVLRKDNPSGLPEKDDSLSIPVRLQRQ